MVMDIVKLEGTYEFTASSLEPDQHSGAKRTSLDLNMAPFVIREEHLCRLIALTNVGMYVLIFTFLTVKEELRKKNLIDVNFCYQ